MGFVAEDTIVGETGAGDARPTTHSCLYECEVMHHRLEPKEHSFRYRIFLFALDLDELDSIRVAGFGRNRRAIYEFRDRDHLTIPTLEQKAPLRDHLAAWLKDQGMEMTREHRVLFVTLPRVFGYIFNPVSFYFITAPDGTPFCSVVQVGNTFGEQKPYLLREQSAPGMFRLITPKHFYVSPFMDLELSFDFKVKVPGEHLDIHIDDRTGDRRILLSALTGKRAPLTSARLAWLTLKYPLITLKVIGLIHWHALLLWFKRIPWHRKAANPHLQKDLLKPHQSRAHSGT